MTPIGTVAALRRYPVKSTAAEDMAQANLFWTGLQGDRTYAFAQAENRTDFPWLTGRQVAALVRYVARYDGPDPKHAALTVTAPDGAAWDIRDPALLQHMAERAGRAVQLVRMGRGTYDAMPVSVLTGRQVDAIGAAHGAPVGAERFRANILLDLDADVPPEAEWMGRELCVGPVARMRLDWAIPRCGMVAIHPATAAKDPSVVQTVVGAFGNRVGTYCAVMAPGPLAVGDRVTLA